MRSVSPGGSGKTIPKCGAASCKGWTSWGWRWTGESEQGVSRDQPEQFFWLFLLNVAGIMLGAWLSGRQAGRWAPKRQIRHGFVIMLLSALVNLVANWFWPAHVGWALIPIAVFSFGWALVVPVVTLLVLDLHPAAPIDPLQSLS